MIKGSSTNDVRVGLAFHVVQAFCKRFLVNGFLTLKSLTIQHDLTTVPY